MNMRGRMYVGVMMALAVFVFVRDVQAAEGVIISEIMWDGVEYVELFNAGGEDILLDEWKMTRQQEGGDEKDIVLFDDGDVLEAGEFLLIERRQEATDFSADKIAVELILVNGGEFLRLYDELGVVVDSANRFGAWFAGENTETGIAMERIDGNVSGEEQSNWQTSTGSVGGRDGTPGEDNSQLELEKVNVHLFEQSQVYSSDIVVSELLPNSVGADAQGEWIELYNGSEREVDLSGWLLDDADGGSRPYLFSDGVHVPGKSYRVFGRGETGIALNNSNDEARLIDPDGKVQSVARYDGSAREGISYSRHGGGIYAWSTTLTPGGPNVITAPVESRTKEGGVEDINVDDTENEAEDYDFSDTIFINEFLPNPVGSDPEGEYIELINSGSVPVRLNGWQLDDVEGGSRPYFFDALVTLAPGEIRSFFRSETNVALNNDADSVRLIDPKGAVVSDYAYIEGVIEGHSFNWDGESEFLLSDELTPGKKNIVAGSGLVSGVSVVLVSIEQMREMGIGDEATIQGVVIAPPGLLGKTVMYVMDGDGGGVQVYSSKGEFGELDFGDMVQVRGEVSSLSGEVRLKIHEEDDVIIVGEGDVPPAQEVATGGVGEVYEGSLIAISGRVTRSNGSTFYVSDGSGEVKVVVKDSTDINKPETKRDTSVSITGVVSETKSGYRVLPRHQDDIQVGLVAGVSDELPEVLEGVISEVELGGVSKNPFAQTPSEKPEQDVSQSEKRQKVVLFGLGLGAAYVVHGAVAGGWLRDFKKWKQSVLESKYYDYVMKVVRRHIDALKKRRLH